VKDLLVEPLGPLGHLDVLIDRVEEDAQPLDDVARPGVQPAGGGAGDGPLHVDERVMEIGAPASGLLERPGWLELVPHTLLLPTIGWCPVAGPPDATGRSSMSICEGAG
jgi:hypothetical protein